MPEVIAFKRHADCREVTFPQCSFGSIYRKMTTFLLTPALGHILGALNDLRCTYTHHEQRAGGERDAQGIWNSKAAATYPPDLNWTLAGAFNALIDDPGARHERRIRQITTPTTLPTSTGAINPPQPLAYTPPQLPPPQRPPRAPDEPSDVSATAGPQTRPAPAEVTPSSVEVSPNALTQPSELPALPSSRTRSKTAIEAMGAALIAASLNDVSLDAIVILSGETHEHIPLPNDPKSHKDALAHDDAEGWLAAERKELRNHKVHKIFEQLDRSSLQTDAQTRSRLIPLQWVYKTKRDGSKKARLVVVGCAQRAGLDYDQTHCSTLKATSSRFLAATAGLRLFKVSTCAASTSCPRSSRATSNPESKSRVARHPAMRHLGMMATTRSSGSSNPYTGCNKEAAVGSARYFSGSKPSAFASAKPIIACFL